MLVIWATLAVFFYYASNDALISTYLVLFISVIATIVLWCMLQYRLVNRIEKVSNNISSMVLDPLTGLANRALLMEQLAKALFRAKRSGLLVAVLFLDLDNLKSVNDVYGHAAGDLMIQVVGQRLGAAIRKHETAARLGGDEFVVVLEDIEDEQAAEKIKGRLADEIRQPMWASQQEFNPSASIGMALYPRDGETPGQLLRVADVAMYVAKHVCKQMARATLSPGLVQ